MTVMQPKVPGLAGTFSGIGGFELGLERAGHRSLCVAEIDPHACAVLDDRMPDSPNLGDVRNIPHLPTGTELVAAGFPCTDLSQAGGKAGLYGDHSRLGLEIVRLMTAQRVPVILLENVVNMLSLGKGAAMDGLLRRFEALGYRWAYRTVDARAFGLPQRRQRVLFCLSLDPMICPVRTLLSDDAGKPTRPTLDRWNEAAFSFSWTEGKAGAGWGFNCTGPLRVGSGLGMPSPPAIVLRDGRVVLPSLRDAERLQGFAPGWTQAADSVEGTGSRGARWRLAGRAIPPAMSEWIGQSLRAQRDADAPRVKPIEDGKSWPKAGWGSADGRWKHAASAYPCRAPLPDLESWLDVNSATPLSVRATRGFLKRFQSGTLRRPPGFIPTLERHAERMEQAA
jgi:DNA (cytosine-5)-methyltransferase 1